MFGIRPRSIACLLLIVIVAGCGPSPAAKKAKLVAQGDAFVANKDFLKGAAAYAAANAISQDGATLMKLTQAYVGAGKFADAYRAAIRAADALPEDADAQIAAVKAQIIYRQFDEATARLTRFLEAHPDNIAALIQQGNLAARLPYSNAALIKRGGSRLTPGDPSWGNVRSDATPEKDAAAEKAFRRALALEKDPKAVDAREALINFLWAVGRAEEAAPMLKQLADEHPEHAVANMAQSDYYLMRQRDAEGEQYLKRAAAVPDADIAQHKLVNLYLEKKRYKDAVDLLSALPAKEDADGSVSVRLAKIEFEMGESDKALGRIEPLLARKPPPAGAALVKAQILISKGEIVQALSLARSNVAADPSSALARATLGEILSATGNLEDAYAEQKEAVSLEPGRIESLQELARLSIALGLAPQAMAHAKEAARLQPGDPDAALNLVKACILARDFAGADKALAPLMKSEPVAAEVLVQSGALLAARGTDDGARAAYTRALQAAPDSVDAISGLVSLDLKQQHAAAARQRAEEAVAKYPREPGFLVLAAQVYAAGNDTARALASLRKAIELDPANLNAALALARSLTAQHPDDAKQVLEKLVERRPHATKALEMLIALRGRTGGRQN